jgi:hypothetical protein
MRKVYTHDGSVRLADELRELRSHPIGSSEIDWCAAERALGVRYSHEQFYLGVSLEPDEGPYREA